MNCYIVASGPKNLPAFCGVVPKWRPLRCDAMVCALWCGVCAARVSFVSVTDHYAFAFVAENVKVQNGNKVLLLVAPADTPVILRSGQSDTTDFY